MTGQALTVAQAAGVAAGAEAGAGSSWFGLAMNVAFALFLLLFPIGMAVLVPPVRGSDPARWRGQMRLLMVLTALATAGWAGWWAVAGAPPRTFWLWTVYPVLLVLGIFVTNHKRADPAIVAQGSPEARAASRTASLQVRRADDLGVPSWAWWAVGAFAFAGFAAAGARFLVAFDDRPEQIRAWCGLLMTVIALGEVGLFAWVVARALPGEARPLDPGGSEELARGYDRLSRQRARGFFAFGAAMTATFAIAGVAMAWVGESAGPAFTAIGVAAGVTIGLAGGAFGTWCSIRAMRLQDRRIELTATGAGPRAE